jgi:hypothetical protein
MKAEKLAALVNEFLANGGSIKFLSPKVPRTANHHPRAPKHPRKPKEQPLTVRKRLPLKAKLRRKYTPLIPNKLYDNFSFWL